MSRPTNFARLILDALDERVVMSATLPNLAAIEPAVLIAGDGVGGAPLVPVDAGVTKGPSLVPAVPTDTGPAKGIPLAPTGTGPGKGDPLVPAVPTGSLPTTSAPAIPNDGAVPKGDPLIPTGTGTTKDGTPKVDPAVTDRLQLGVGPSPIISLSGAHSLLVSARLTDANGQPINRAGVFTVYLNGVKQSESAAGTGVLLKTFAVPYGAYTVTVTFGPPAGAKGTLVTSTVRYLYQAPASPFAPAKGSVFGSDISNLFAPIVVG